MRSAVHFGELKMKLSSNQVDILDHTAHRAANGVFCGGGKEMTELVSLGLMVSRGKTSFCPDEYFSMTEAGATALKQFKK